MLFCVRRCLEFGSCRQHSTGMERGYGNTENPEHCFRSAPLHESAWKWEGLEEEEWKWRMCPASMETPRAVLTG